MGNRSIALDFRCQLLAGAALSFLALSLAPQQALAADVVCTPNASGTAIASATETCTGSGDKIDYATATATVNSTVTLNAVNIPSAAVNGVAINPGTTAQTVIVNAGGNIKAVGGDGLRILATSGTATLSVGTSANRVLSPISGGNGALAANGIRIDGLGDINLFTGNVAIVSTSTAGASWGIRARSLPPGAGVGGAVVVDTQGAISGPAGIQATTTGTDVTDSVTVISTGPVTGLAGAGIQVRSVNGNSTVTSSAAVIGSTGTANHGIDVSVSGTGNASVTTLAGGTVTANAGTIGILVASTTGGMTVNVGADVTSTGNTAVKTNSFASTGTNTITIGTATIRGLGTTSTSGSIDMSSQSGGLTTLNTGTGTAIFSNSATAALQNADLAIKGTGGNVVINNAGSIRGTMDFANVTVATNSVTLNNTSAVGWHATGTSTFGAGNDVVNNAGLLATNGATTLAFAGGTDVFNNNAGGTFFTAETAGASTTTLTGLETFNNGGTISLVDSETNDVFNAASAAYVGSGAGTIRVDASLAGGTSQSGCVTATVADCVVLGAVTGTSTIIVNDTNGPGAASLTSSSITLVHVTSGSASSFVLGGTSAVNTPQGLAIQKGLVQYQLAFDATNSNYNLVTVVGAPSVEMGSVMTGMQNVWHITAEGADDRMAALRRINTASLSGAGPIPAQGGADGYSVWGKAYYGGFERDAIQTLGAFSYDTSYKQSTGGLEIGVDRTSRDANSALVLGALVGYSGSNLKFEVDSNKAHYSMWHFGAYASYMSGPLFVDVLVKDDATKVKFDFPSVSQLDDKTGNSFGAKLTVGERLENSGIVFEPMASVALVHSSLSNIDTSAASFDFNDGNSIRGTLGLRLSGNVGEGPMAIEPFLFAGIGEEFDGLNSAVMNSGGFNLQVKDRPIRMFGVGSVGFNVLGSNGFSAFLRADGLLASNAKSLAVWTGLRFAL